MEINGYSDFAASDLPKTEQDRLRLALQRDLVEAMVRAVKEKPPDVDLSQIELILRPGEDLASFNVAADCGTCGTCGTGGGCGTCGTS
jgi:hypothetical protein